MWWHACTALLAPSDEPVTTTGYVHSFRVAGSGLDVWLLIMLEIGWWVLFIPRPSPALHCFWVEVWGWTWNGSLIPRLSFPVQNCETKSGMEGLGMILGRENVVRHTVARKFERKIRENLPFTDN